jgi:hypothetical protein
MTSHKSISETWRERDRARQRGQQRHQPSLQQRQQPRSYPCVEYTTLRTPRSKLRNVTNTQTWKRTTYSNLRFSRHNVENEMFEWLCTPAMIRTGRSQRWYRGEQDKTCSERPSSTYMTVHASFL